MKIDVEKLSIPLKERLKSIPEAFGIRLNEEPSYEVVMTDGDFEVRRYKAHTIAKISLQGMTFDDFREAAFKKLAHYIFEGNEKHSSIPMTSPVMEQHGTEANNPKQISMTSPFMQQENEPGGWTMSFILPKEFTVKSAPTPNDQSVVLEEVPERLLASISYSGNNTLENVKEHERKLADWLKKQPNIQSSGRFMVAQYDAPFVIPFLKKNEIMVQVDNMH